RHRARGGCPQARDPPPRSRPPAHRGLAPHRGARSRRRADPERSRRHRVRPNHLPPPNARTRKKSKMTPPSSDPALEQPTAASSTTNSDGTQISMTTKDMRRVIASSFMGSMIEFYDFILYATAASIVFGKVF